MDAFCGPAARAGSRPCWLSRGTADGEPLSYYLYNVADHEEVYASLGVQATAYQTGIPPVIAAQLIAEGAWGGAGVRSPEEFDPDPFLERLAAAGMPWHVRPFRAQQPEPERGDTRLAVVAA